MQTAVNNIDSNSPTLAEISIEKNCVKNEILSMELPRIFLSTTTSKTTTTTTTTTATSKTNDKNATMDEHEYWQYSKNFEAMPITSSVSPSKQETPTMKLRRQHRKTSPEYAMARQDYLNIAKPTNNTSSSSSTSSTSDISVINNVANNIINKQKLNFNSVNNGCTLGSSAMQEQEEVQSLSVQSKLLQIPPQTLSIISYGDQYYSGLSDSCDNSENSSPLAPSTTPSGGTCSHSSNISTPNAADRTLIKKNAQDVSLELLQWKDMPQYLQFNPYVLRGYRPLQTFRGCLLSLFYWHNETINILTHAIPIVYILAIVPGLMPWENEFRFLSFCHLLGSVAPWCGSFIYHVFMNIEMGENIYYLLLKLDMVGIWVSQSFGALPLVTATTFCFSWKWKWAIILSYCLLCLWGLYKALTATSPWGRRLCFALPFFFRSILNALRTLGLLGGTRVALSHVYLQLEVDGVSILGGAIGAMRIPEKWFPGLVDYYLNSHNIMHVLVVVAVYSMHKATIKDFEWMSTATCEEFNTTATEIIESALFAHVDL